jgi:AAA family ATP:ADP antiporter
MTRTTEDLPGERKTWLDRTLSLFTEVRAGEGVSALLLAANVFYLLTVYSILKVVRDALILTEGGAEVKSYSAAGQALIALAFVPAYGAFASRVNRIRLIGTVTLFFASHLIVFYLLGAGGTRIGVPFYLWTGIFNLVIIAQFWAFANDVYSPERGKRLFPLVGLGASLGAVVGAAAAVLFAGVGPYRLMVVASAGLLIPIGLTLWVSRRERSSGRDAAAARAEEPLGTRGGFQLVVSDRYLGLIALLFVVLNLVNTLGGFLLDRLIVDESLRLMAAGAGADQREIVSRLSGGVQFSVNVLGFLFQAFLVSRIFKYIGVRGALFVLPLLALGSYALIALVPIFSVVRWAKILENSTDYSIQQTARHALFLPTSREAKYKAKQAIESFFWRAGDLLQAVVVFVGLQLAFSIRGFAAINIVLTIGWLALVVAIAREHRKLTAADAAEKAA